MIIVSFVIALFFTYPTKKLEFALCVSWMIEKAVDCGVFVGWGRRLLGKSGICLWSLLTDVPSKLYAKHSVYRFISLFSFWAKPTG